MRWFAIFLATVSMASWARAHKILVDAWVERGMTPPTICGECRFGSGDAVKDAPVEIQSEAGEALGETRTDAQGAFRFVPTRGVTHVLLVKAGEGHAGKAVVDASDLPESLPGGVAPATTRLPGEESPTLPGPAVSPDLEQVVARAVAAEVAPLRRDLAALREKLWLHDVLGGLGWILGLAGLWAWLASRRGRPS